MLAKEVLTPVDLAGLGEGRVFGVERGHAEHLAGALAVTRGDDGGVDVDKALLLEEAVDSGSCDRADAEHGAEQVGARAQVLLGAQELDGCALLLQRVIRCARALDLDGGGRKLEGLGRIGGQLDGAGADECSRDVLMGDLVVVVERLAVHDDLQVAEAAAVVERNEAKVLHVADGLDPAGNGDGLATERLGIGVELRDFGAVHVSSHNGCTDYFQTVNHSNPRVGRSKTSGVMYGRDVGTAQAPILRCLVPADGLAYEGSVGVDSRLGEVCAVVDKVFAVAL